jgi:hypothetical protein
VAGGGCSCREEVVVARGLWFGSFLERHPSGQKKYKKEMSKNRRIMVPSSSFGCNFLPVPLAMAQFICAR